MAAKLAGGGGDSKWHVEANSEINVTPFVDVMLVLLIIFMVAAPLATIDVKVTLPTSSAKSSPSPSKIVYLTVSTDGALHIGNNPTSLDSLAADLKTAIGKRDAAHERIFIRGDKDSEYGDFMALMTKLQDSGFYSVALVGEDHNLK